MKQISRNLLSILLPLGVGVAMYLLLLYPAGGARALVWGWDSPFLFGMLFYKQLLPNLILIAFSSGLLVPAIDAEGEFADPYKRAAMVARIGILAAILPFCISIALQHGLDSGMLFLLTRGIPFAIVTFIPMLIGMQIGDDFSSVHGQHYWVLTIATLALAVTLIIPQAAFVRSEVARFHRVLPPIHAEMNQGLGPADKTWTPIFDGVLKPGLVGMQYSSFHLTGMQENVELTKDGKILRANDEGLDEHRIVRLRAGEYLAYLLLILLIAYWLWSKSGRSAPKLEPDPRLELMREFGEDSGAGNVIAISPWMLTTDYASQANFERKLDCYFQTAGEKGWLNPKTIVMLPEYLGTWLVVAGEKRSVCRVPSVKSAMRLMVLSNLPYIASHAVSPFGSDRLTYAIFSAKGRLMAALYDRTLSSLARKYEVTIVGGSIILPWPNVWDRAGVHPFTAGRLNAGKGPLYNVCPIYRPDGNADPNLVEKVYPIDDEEPWLSSGLIRFLPVFDTPACKLGVLICADSWYLEPYEILKREGAEFVATVSYQMDDGSWKAPWKGCRSKPDPKDLVASDIGSITQEEAWVKYTLPGRLHESGIPAGMTVFLRGKLWDLGTDGGTILVRGRKTDVLPSVDGASIVNYWLPGR